MQGETGLIAVTGTPEAPARVGVSVCDVGAGSYAAVATAAALARRAATGEGAHVSVSLFDTMVDWLGYFPHVWWHKREEPTRTGLRHPHFCPYGPYRAGDGRLVGFAILSDAHWTALARDVLDRPDLLADADLATNEARVASRERLERDLETRCRLETPPSGSSGSRPRGIPCGDVNTVGDVMEHPQLAHNRLTAEVDSPAGPIPTVGVPFLVERRPDRAGLGSRSRRAHRRGARGDRIHAPRLTISEAPALPPGGALRARTGARRRPVRSRARVPGSTWPG